MQPDFVKDSILLEIGWAAAIVVMAIALAWLIVRLMRGIQHRLERSPSKSTLVSQGIQSFVRPLLVYIILDGFLLALSTLSFMQQWAVVLQQVGIVVLISVITYALANIGAALLAWYMRVLSAQRKARFDEGLIRFISRILKIIIFLLGILILLDFLNIAISPIIAGLGIGGLAVALALQPTLGNFFASSQIISDRVVRVGDYIELENPAIRGYVTDVGWRSTRIRTPFNNMVIIPNSRLSESIITNYYGPTMEMGVVINCGVSYNANLLQVEKISLEVAREVVGELEEADKTFEPSFAYDEFGDSNINFWIWVRAKDRLSSFKLKSEIIKRLKSRLDAAGITINYPARLLTFEKGYNPAEVFKGEQD